VLVVAFVWRGAARVGGAALKSAVVLSGRKPSLFWLAVEEKKEGERGVKREDGWLAWSRGKA
jgi:hypothetical protein